MKLKRLIRRARRRFHRAVEKRRHKLALWRRSRRRALERRIKRWEKQEAEQKAPSRMFDSITLDAIPAGAEAVAGYVNGWWPTFDDLKRRWPDAERLSIAVTSSACARCLDVEPGDAEPGDAPGWLGKMADERKGIPVIYVMLSQAQFTVELLERAGYRLGRDFLLWTAHYTYRPHLCGPECGFGLEVEAHATQFTDRSGGDNLDESVCSPDLFS